jgi:small-conductance mechanosensitive channel
MTAMNLAWLEQTSIPLAPVFVTVALLVGTAVVNLALNRVVRRFWRRVEARIRLPYESVLFTTRFVTSAVWIVALLLILQAWGVGVGGLWAVLASVTAIIGVGFLAVWTMVSNVTASLFITLWRPFHLGQSIEILPENLKGRAVDRNMMFTTLREEGGSILQVPNNLFFQKMFRVAGSPTQSMFESFEEDIGRTRRMPAE